MALKECKDCGKEVSTNAKTCPHCGAPARASSVLIVLVKAILIVIILWLGWQLVQGCVAFNGPHPLR